MSPSTQIVDVVRKRLIDLEEALEMPLVAGELTAWTSRVAGAARIVHSLLTEHLAQAHRDDYAEIAEQDLEMATCVDNMKAEDAAIRLEFERFMELAGNVAVAATRAEPDELILEKAREHLVDHGLALVLRIRKQEAAVRTWYIEAFQRDRGVGD
ncbi:MAG: hypothetical protein K8T91_11700 [Planctomycetes bacterium]|nr:hypothetical protein [Planctomycetota bacterium]